MLKLIRAEMMTGESGSLLIAIQRHAMYLRWHRGAKAEIPFYLIRGVAGVQCQGDDGGDDSQNELIHNPPSISKAGAPITPRPAKWPERAMRLEHPHGSGSVAGRGLFVGGRPRQPPFPPHK